jgi:uncharacterized membrane protein YkvA (DUF1232 family)
MMFKNLKARARALKNDLFALYLAYRDKRTPWYARIWAALVLAYAFSPIDLIPDFVPVLGYLDDVILVPAGIALALKMIPPRVMTEAREKAAQEAWGRSPLRVVGAAVIVLIWLLLAVWVTRIFISLARGLV